MAREIEMMLLNQEKRIELGDQARRRVEEHYSIDAIATRYQNFYQLLCQL
jgi:glycosyltransferase involved in cell wall biosynthesis